MPPYKRSDWNGLLGTINTKLQNPPAGCGSAISPIPLADPHHRWSRTDILTVQSKITLTNPAITFLPLPTRQRWAQSLLNEINAGVDLMWAGCSGGSAYCTDGRLAAELAANGSGGYWLSDTSTPIYDGEEIIGWEYELDARNAVCRVNVVYFGNNQHSVVPRFTGRTWEVTYGGSTIATGSLDEGGLPVGAGIYTGTSESSGSSIHAHTTSAQCVSLPSGDGRSFSETNPLVWLGPLFRHSDGNLGLAKAVNTQTATVIGFAVDGEWTGPSSTGWLSKVWYITHGSLCVPTPLMVEEYQTQGNALLVPGATYYLSAAYSGMITRYAPSSPGQYVVQVGTAQSQRVLTVDIGTPIPV